MGRPATASRSKSPGRPSPERTKKRSPSPAAATKADAAAAAQKADGVDGQAKGGQKVKKAVRQLKRRAALALKEGRATAAQALHARAAALRTAKGSSGAPQGKKEDGPRKRSPTPPAPRRAKLTARATVQSYDHDDPASMVKNEKGKDGGKKAGGKGKSKNKNEKGKDGGKKGGGKSKSKNKGKKGRGGPPQKKGWKDWSKTRWSGQDYQRW